MIHQVYQITHSMYHTSKVTKMVHVSSMPGTQGVSQQYTWYTGCTTATAMVYPCYSHSILCASYL